MFKTRYLQFVVALTCVVVATTGDADAARHKRGHKRGGSAAVSTGPVSDPRYADIIMNPITGEVYHSKDPDGRRYPASLTKMMTLYLLFEALDQGKVTMGTRMEVSDYASTMPQTNLALQPGDTIPVETAIKALVVRSANDVAVVVGESLGGDVDHFAEMMTAKAHALGMSNTVFKNPNGLPNSEQHTTARDMAKLGIALKRDFPRYYPYFSTREFSWNGANYYTHNRVMLRYAGTDGIKTGFIGASGFNLVTSVTRGGRPLVGTVMGGMSGAWRDNRMIALLDETYKTIAARGAVRGSIYPTNLPSSSRRGAAPAASAGTSDKFASTVAVDLNADGAANDEAPATAATAAPTAAAPAAPAASIRVVPAAKLAKPASAPTSAAKEDADVPPMPEKLSKKAAKAARTKTAAADTSPNWGIQVGAFSSHALADQAATQSIQLAKKSLSSAKPLVIDPDAKGAPVYRARLVGLTQAQAQAACSTLISNHSPCFIYRSGN